MATHLSSSSPRDIVITNRSTAERHGTTRCMPSCSQYLTLKPTLFTHRYRRATDSVSDRFSTSSRSLRESSNCTNSALYPRLRPSRCPISSERGFRPPINACWFLFFYCHFSKKKNRRNRPMGWEGSLVRPCGKNQAGGHSSRSDERVNCRILSAAATPPFARIITGP